MLKNYVAFTLTSKEMYYFAVLVARAGEEDIKSDETKKWCREIIEDFSKDWSPPET